MESIVKSVELLKAISDLTRFRILYNLRDKTMCVKEIAGALELSQSAISHQLKVLKDNNLVKSYRSGKEVFYTISDEHVKNILEQVIVHVDHIWGGSILKRQLILKNVDNSSLYRKIEFDIAKEFTNGFVSVNNEKSIVNIHFNSDVKIDEDLDLIKSIINKVDSNIEIIEKEELPTYRKVLILENLDCANCAAKIERIAKRNFNYDFLVVDLATSRFIIETSDEVLNEELVEKVQEITSSVDSKIIVHSQLKKVAPKHKKITNKKLILFVSGLIVFLIGLSLKFILKHYYGTLPTYLNLIVLLTHFVSYILLGGDVLYGAFKNIKSGRVFDEKFLMGLATLTALWIGYYEEAVSVMIFYKIGELLQDYAVNRSRNSIKDLIGVQNVYANIEVKNEIVQVDPLEVFVGDVMIIKNGEKIPLDGQIIHGETSLDMSALTGESLYREVNVGDEVLSGSINKGNLIKVKVTKIYEDSTMPKIFNLIENASSLKSKSENFISKFARYYTPIVVILALLMIILLPVAERDYSWAAFQTSIYKAMVFLVISCPCALVISIPLGFFGGIGGASKQGILVKGSNYLEALNSVHTIVFDKTGTLTKGEFKIANIVSENGFTKDDVLEYAAYAESVSNHPIARSIVNEYGSKNINFSELEVTDQKSTLGVIVKRLNKELVVGKDDFVKEYGIEVANVEEIGVVVHVAYDGVYMGYLIISDEIKPEVASAIANLKSLGVKQIIMLTGDNEAVAQDVANKLGIDHYWANLLPADKVRKLLEIKSTLKEDEKIVFAGDGVNDAPALSTADIGIAMGALGSDAAIEVADVVLMSDEISKLPTIIKIARKTRRIVLQNIVLALGVKLLVLFSAPLASVYIWEAIFADVGVSLIAILNSMRIIKEKY